MIPGLQAKKYDVIISSMSITEDRQKVRLHRQVLQHPQQDVCKKDIKFDGPASIKGKKIGVLKGLDAREIRHGRAQNRRRGCGVLTRHRTRSTWTSRPAVWTAPWPTRWKSNRWFSDQTGRQNYQFVGEALHAPSTLVLVLALALRKGQAELKGQINAAIKAIRANGKYKAINDKYFKFDVYGK
jgi:arginine/ornithine transport system substrate-binding protein